MSDFSLNEQNAKRLKLEVEKQSQNIQQLAKIYSEQKDALLKSWEGTHKDAFQNATNNDFATIAVNLAKKIQQLSIEIHGVAEDYKKKDQTGANIINNGH